MACWCLYSGRAGRKVCKNYCKLFAFLPITNIDIRPGRKGMASRGLSEDSTIYHYTLLYRFTKKHPFYWFYLICLVLWLFVDIVYWRLEGLMLFAGTITLVIVIHMVIVILLRRLSQGTVPRTWAWTWTFPFCGYIPSGYVSASSWGRANRHRLMLGFALVALLYVWVPLNWLANAAAAHYFLLLPQLIYIGRCIRINRYGLVKVNEHDISFYKN